LKRIIVFSNGYYNNMNFYSELITSNDYIICADGGANYALSIGVRPDMVVGDLDSIDKTVYKQLLDLGTTIEKYPCEKDMSDLEIALEKAIEYQPEEIVIFGALGNRLDQTLNNINILLLPLRNDIKASIVDEYHQVQLFNKKITINGNSDDYLSLYPLTEDVSGVTTEGLKFPLNGEILYFASTRGLSNEFINNMATITIEKGLLLVIKVKRTWKN